jgi:hypothetical protein
LERIEILWAKLKPIVEDHTSQDIRMWGDLKRFNLELKLVRLELRWTSELGLISKLNLECYISRLVSHSNNDSYRSMIKELYSMIRELRGDAEIYEYMKSMPEFNDEKSNNSSRGKKRKKIK